MRILAKRRGDRIPGVVLLLAIALPPLAQARAQDVDGLKVYSEQLRVALDEQVPQRREEGVDAGGWLNFAFFHFNDGSDPVARTLRQYQLRGWARFNVHDVHRGYVRGLLDWEDWGAGDNPIDGRGDSFTEYIERAWYQLDLGRLLMNGTDERPAVDVRIKAGRQFATIGTALALSMPMDMIKVDLTANEWSLMAMLGRTVENTDNIDDSEPVARHQNRCFWGAELAYEGLDHHRPFAYYLSNRDHTSPTTADPSQSYDYTSRYVGVGSEGTIVLPDLRYQAEVVGEWGKTFSNEATVDQDRICALAVDVLLAYLFQTPTHPKLMVEYLFGSGDGDRQVSATATTGGNLQGTRDTAFNAFGFRDTGISLAPRVSNIHVYILGASFFPLETRRPFEKLEIGSKVFFYDRAKSASPISDSGAENAGWIGWEWDVFCNWRLTSDLAWTIRYGAFMPGSAYSDQTCRHFLYSGVVFSF